MKNIALFCDVNLNLLDGSTLWAKNTANVISSIDDVQLTVFLRDEIDNSVIVDQLDSAIQVVAPSMVSEKDSLSYRTLPHNRLSHILPLWEREKGVEFDFIVVRGRRFVEEFSTSIRFRKKLVVFWIEHADYTATQPDPLYRRLHENNVRLIVQSSAMRQYLEVYGQYFSGNIIEMPPIVDRNVFSPGSHSGLPNPLTLSYSGKLDKHYGLAWLLDIIEGNVSNKDQWSKVKFEICEGKITNPREDQDLFDRYKSLSGNSRDNLTLHKGVGQNEVAASLRAASFGYCLRNKKYESSSEISTKLFEYCSVGTPLLLNKTETHVALLGDDYPFFFQIDQISPDAVLERMANCTALDYEFAQERCLAVAERFGGGASRKAYENIFNVAGDEGLSLGSISDEPIKITVAGHDLKFLVRILNRLETDRRFDISFDHWATTSKPAVPRSKFESNSDVVFCEWACQNAVWFSKNKKPGQRLIVRLHRFEMYSPFPKEVSWQNVDQLIVVSDYFKQLAVNDLGVDPKKIIIFPQFIEAEQLDRPKRASAKFTIGMVGINPYPHKRFDRAIEFFEQLVEADPRYRLKIRSVMPWDIPWLWDGRVLERQLYTDLFDRILANDLVRERITFDAPGNDMEEWFREVSFILSSSDTEGCHTSIIEGMASGCRPIVYAWPGANTLFPTHHIYDDLADAISSLQQLDDGVINDDEARQLKASVAGYSSTKFLQLMMKLLTDS